MINYQNIADSITFYEKLKYSHIESPWTVTKQVALITKPKFMEYKPDFQILHNKKVLVASGEQSFLYLYLKGFLPKGTFQTVTPCFRYDEFDEYHTKYFIKNELINTNDATNYELDRMIEHALDFFSSKLDCKYLQVIENDSNGFDIQYKGIELGSYGIRSCKFLDWVYGTGCAEPRLSSCQDYKLKEDGEKGCQKK